MDILGSSAEMRAWSRARRRIGFVPTMGYLHEGHRSLMRLARPLCDHLVVSIYVNPLQFGPNEDLDRYPRDPEGDLAACSAEGVDAVFMPPDLYPDGFCSVVKVNGLTERLCGASRPTHFAGVTTVCTRLFGLVGCELAVFGEKDFQQLMVIRRMVEDLALPVRILPGQLVRDGDGLALSSRNRFLSADDRRRALCLHRALFAIRDAWPDEADAAALLARGRDVLALGPGDRLDYLEIVDAETLLPMDRVQRPSRVVVAAYVGPTRLIDNVALGPPLAWT